MRIVLILNLIKLSNIKFTIVKELYKIDYKLILCSNDSFFKTSKCKQFMNLRKNRLKLNKIAKNNN